MNVRGRARLSPFSEVLPLRFKWVTPGGEQGKSKDSAERGPPSRSTMALQSPVSDLLQPML